MQELLADINVRKPNEPNLSKLPFLHARILERIYYNISQNIITSIEDLSDLTDYPPDSKILQDAIDSLIRKNYLCGNLDIGFSIPDCISETYKKLINKLDYKHRVYSDKIIKFLEAPDFPLLLFDEYRSISDLNKLGVIHKWYNYLEDFPYTLIEDKIKEYKVRHRALIVDPFCGSGTTLISANMFRCNAIGFDANPLMTFISKIKTTWDINLDNFEVDVINISSEFLNKVHYLDKTHFKSKFLRTMPKREIDQWLSMTLRKEVALLKDIITEKSTDKIRGLLLLALSKSCFDASYVSLCPGTTFYPFRERAEFWDIFTNKIIQIYKDLKAIQTFNSYGKSKVITDTCLDAKKYIKNSTIDFMITSPPYPNDLEYTRQTRLELYLLDFVSNMDDVQSIKKKMVKGSTKLIFKESNSSKFIDKFDEINSISNQIYEQTKHKNWGFDYPRMVREYFGDMYLCMKEFHPLLKKNACFLLVVGDQTVKGVYIPVCDILIKMAKKMGYNDCKKELFRIRRSTGHNIPLPEEVVVIRK